MKRLASLDILRGLDLFLLVFLQPILWDLLTRIGTPGAAAVLYHFDHEVWEGFRLWDLVMPLFLFMSGVSMPFAYARHLRGEVPLSHTYRKAVRRFFLLFLLGMVVQGNLLGLDPAAMQIYTNTLQAIAAGYLITVPLVLHLQPRGRLVAIVLLLAAYSLPMMLCGDFTPEGNLACRIDEAVLGRFRGDPSYAWLLPSLTFGVTVSLGAWAGQIIRSGGAASRRTALLLALIGTALVGLGALWGLSMPIVKRIWTASMALYSGGWCFLLMALCYYVIDVCGIRRPFDWLRIYGMNSIAAYVLGEVVNFRSAVHSVSYGLAPLLGDFYAVWLTFGNFLLLFFLLLALHRAHVYIKV